jgi:hypothetical protein
MTNAALNRNLESPGDSRRRQILSILALVPAGAYAVSTVLTLTAGSSAPTEWLRDLFAQSAGAIFVIWAVLLGGPVLSLVANLTLERPGQRAPFQKVCTIIAWMLLLWCLVTTVPFPWFFLDY